MENKELEHLFDRLKGSFDVEEPAAGHRARFQEKLEASKQPSEAASLEFAWADRTKKGWWKPFAVAASIALACLITVGLLQTRPTINEQVAEISPEVSRTHYYFAGLIEQQVNELESESDPQSRQMIDDAMVQLKKLESDYARLEKDLLDGGNSKLILSAMITNFRTRIDLLQDVSHEIETIKQQHTANDTQTTI